MKLFRDRFLVVALIIYVIFWIALAISPSDRGDWFLENLLIFISVAVLAVTYRKFQFTNLSYALILVFLVFHTIGAHYTYAKVPAGFWLQDWLHLKRNHYDRVIHFAFGFLLVYPMSELLADLGAAYLGTQGDIWDAQKDMGCAFIGALLVATWLTIGRGMRPGQG